MRSGSGAPALTRALRVGLAALFLVVAAVWSVQAQDVTTTPEAGGSSAFAVAQEPSLSQDELKIMLLPLTEPELAGLAEIWQGHLRQVLEEVARVNRALLTAGSALTDDLRAELLELSRVQKARRENYDHVLDEWERKGADPEAVAAHRAYVTALTYESVSITDFRTIARLALAWTVSREGGVGILMRLAMFLLGLWAAVLLSRFTRLLAGRGLDRSPGLSKLLRSFVLTLVFWGTFVLGVVALLVIAGIEVTPLLAVFGGLSFIVGFAMQETLGNAVSGFIIMMTKPFDIGDYIKTDAVSGIVEKMSALSTRVRTFDNQVIQVPNSKVWNGVITNVTASATRRVDLVFPIARGEDATRAIGLIERAIAAHPLCLDDPAPQVFVGEIGEHVVSIWCRPWARTEDHWTVYVDLTGEVRALFDREGIAPPSQRREVTLQGAAPAVGESTGA